MKQPQISVIIPVLNEESSIGKLLTELKNRSDSGNCEFIVADGGSTDKTRDVAERAGAVVIKSKKGRAVQMNTGATRSSADILYFLHADTIPPPKFDLHIIKSIRKEYGAGCFYLQFDDSHPGLRFYSWFTRLKSTFIRFGDQSLFVTESVFKEVNGFDESLVVMEDQKIVRKIKWLTKFKVVDKPVITSARKYRKNGVYRLQAVFFLIWAGYYLGLSQKVLTDIYRKYIH